MATTQTDDTHQAELEAYAERVRAHRAQMVEAVAGVEDALAHPIAVPRWRERVLASVAELANDFRQHRDLTEGDAGWYAAILADAPQLASQIDRLTSEHLEISAAVAQMLAHLEAEGPLVDAAGTREDLTTLVGQLIRHRQQGSDLTYAAYAWDLGGSG